ncbi:BglG family transcription antiterminator [Paenibacillus jiagnxiensis]|uniref:BglG family transcription antiterminator n=1 Tax=Paenibacillus jiagnxiensis TaxID=3228926 RepID=UPI0033ABAA86
MNLDERSADVLQLLQQSSSLKMDELQERTELSRRQLQYSIGKINDWLIYHGYQPVGYERQVGYFLTDRIREEDLPEKLTRRSYTFSEVDREKMFGLMILLGEEPLSVFHFQSIASVSRNTVLKDLQRLKRNMQERKLQVQYSKIDGYSFKGSSRAKRRLVEEWVPDILHSASRELMIRSLWPDREEQIQAIQQQLEQIERQLGMTFADERLQELTYLMLCTDQLIGKGEVLDDNKSWEELTASGEYKLVERMTSSGAFHAKWSRTECLYATLHLLGMNRTRDISPLQEDHEIRRLMTEITDEFERWACVSLHDRETFYRQLYIHFRPAYYRMLYGIHVVNTMAARIRKVYPDLYHLTRKSLQPLERVLGHPVPESEAAYFTIHFGGWLRRQGTMLDDRKRAIVVCANGIGMSNILIYTLREMFPDILFLDALSVRDAAESNLEYDMVFSTVHLRTDKSLFVVPPILELQDKQKLRQQVMNELYGYTVENMDTSSLMKIIAQYAVISDEEELGKALQQHIYAQAHKTNKHSLEGAEKPVLDELITEQNIIFQTRASDWKEAIRLASRPLLEIGTIEPRYVEAMIRSIEENGPYVVITPGVAIPHARPDQGVRSLSMSFMRLDEAVEFGPGKPVRLVIILAAADRSSHLKALVQLTQLLGEPSNIEDILNSSDKSVVLNYIQQYSKEEQQQ